MNPNPLTKVRLEVNGGGIGEISGEMVTKRATELALIAGRPMTKKDSEQALRELIGGDDVDPKQASLEFYTEDQRWNPVPGSSGHKSTQSSSEEEDEDGHSKGAQLVEEGISEAEHDQMLQAAMAAREADLSGS